MENVVVGCACQGNGNGIVVENEIAVDDRCGDESRENEIDGSFGGRVKRFDGFEKRSVIDGWKAENVL